MGKNTAISWTHHTFNPWWGCEKVSPACAHCYAETFAERWPASRGLWGKGSGRRFQSDKYWNTPLSWDAASLKAWDAARGSGLPLNQPARHRVFCASMADVFEDRDDLIPHRARLLELIRRTPNLDWLLLTKRPENVMRHIVEAKHHAECVTGTDDLIKWLGEWLDGTPPANVWLGSTVENQEQADKRIPALLSIPAKVRFLSCEPLLGPLNLFRLWMAWPSGMKPIQWVICGGESGPKARPMHPDWARSLRDQCAHAGVAFHFKQWGAWVPVCAQYPQTEAEFEQSENAGLCGAIAVEDNGVIAEGYQPVTARAWLMDRASKDATRLLDGVLHDAFPA